MGGSAGKFNNLKQDFIVDRRSFEVGKHNKNALQEDDYIVEVNGVQGDSYALLEELTKKQKNNTLQLLVSRGEPVDETVERRLMCAWQDSGKTFYLNAGPNWDEQRGDVGCYILNSDWTSEIWYVHDAGNGFKRFQNKMNGLYLNHVYDAAQVALNALDEESSGWDSMKWKEEPISEGTSVPGFRFQNGDQHGLGGAGQYWYLNMGPAQGGDNSRDDRPLGLAYTPPDNYLSAQWALDDSVPVDSDLSE